MVMQLETRREVEREPEQTLLMARHLQLQQQLADKQVCRIALLGVQQQQQQQHFNSCRSLQRFTAMHPDLQYFRLILPYFIF